MTKDFPIRIKTLSLAGIGAALFWFAGLPLPFLFGPLTACLVAALAGADLRGMGQVSVAARTVLGVAAGASITPDVVHALPRMAQTVALVPLFVALIALVGVPYFRALGFDRVTSWYAAMPGGLQDMVVFGQEAGGDVRALSLIHATRVLIIVTLAPFIATHLYGVSLSHPIGAPAIDMPPDQIGLMLFAALAGWKGAEKLRLFGASILGPMIVAAILSLSGLLHMRPPREAIMAAQLLIGLGIGISYVGVTWRELRRFVVTGVAFVVILAALSAAFTEAITLLHLAPPVDAFLAFAPGGQAEMTLLAIITGADLGFVIVHHLTRVILVILGAPVAAKLFMRRR
ncbi:AbrB family transcriptional regulator [Gemmobacter sp. LW-1]|uniref:AbrB family transcriptional regulator n=1 Tax=Gemmobacter sp. LW-1 TaxID=1529005 RepID=UPI0006C7671D|nr:AbrB family transcriptional regulator [Gemmobacter sp. LW-1]